MLRAAGDEGSFEIPVLKHQYSAEVAGCKIFAIQNAKTEILVETENCNDLGGRRWQMTRRRWTGEGS
jgi:hypothetical protein